MLTTSATAPASEIGQQVANQVNADTYHYYLDERLYTHDGDNRGTWPKGPEHGPARDNMVATFQDFGLSVELQEVDGWPSYYNVVATQWGSVHPDSYYVVGAHYDSVHNAGADDNASGVAGVLEIARVLSLYQTEYTIKYIAFDVEEWGLYGSEAYVEDHLTDDIRGMVSLDMIAYDDGGYTCDIYGRAQSDPVKLALADAIDLYGNGLIAWVYGQHDGSDHAPFEWAGFRACLLIEDWGNPCYHHSCDSVDTPNYISYNYAADMVRSTAGFLADQAVAFQCEAGSWCEVGVLGDEDCNGNGVWDICDIVCGGAPDCNGNGIPDDCDIANGTSQDCNQNGTPDECELAYPHGPDEFGYTYGDSNDVGGPALGYEDISSSGTLIVSGDHNATTTALPFTFGFYAVDYVSLAASTNGLLNFLGDADPYCCEGRPVPDPEWPNATIAVWWEDLVTTVRVETRGTAPYRRFIVQWDGNHCCDGTAPVVFQAKLFETTNTIEFQYLLANSDGGQHSVGIEDDTGTVGLQYFLGNGSLSTPLAVAFAPPGGLGDCNQNGILDECDIASGTSADINGNGVPDECEPCVGDLNCDGTVGFGDINPFILYLSNVSSWQAAFPGCDPVVGDINCDGSYGDPPDFGDINPFVALMTQCHGDCPCPGPGCQ
jgi:hypothetical protein